MELDKRGLSERRKQKYIILLKKFKNIRLAKLTRRQVDNFFLYLKNSKLADLSKDDYFRMFRIFCKWLRPKMDLSQYKLQVRTKFKLPEEILTLDEVRKIILTAKTIRDRAMLSLLYDSGCRPFELLSLSDKDISFDDDGLIVVFNGKTGARRVRIITTLDSDKFLKDYLEVAGSGVEPIFGKLTIERLNQIAKGYAKRLGINKRVYSYIFRHSRATHLAKHLTEAQMKVYLGWSMSSDMVATYVHLSGRDMDERILELNHNPSVFIPSESFKQFLFEKYQEWKVLNSRKINYVKEVS